MFVEICFDSLLVLLCIGTVFVQFHESQMASFLKRIDLFSILPYWTFFAPNPIANDYRIFWISRNMDELDVEEWDEIIFISERKWFHFLWNPNKRKSKAIIDIIQYLTVYTKDLSSNQIVLSIGYLNLSQFVENYIFEHQLQAHKEGFQYIITTDEGYASQSDQTDQSPQVIFRSAFHHYSIS